MNKPAKTHSHSGLATSFKKNTFTPLNDIVTTLLAEWLITGEPIAAYAPHPVKNGPLANENYNAVQINALLKKHHNSSIALQYKKICNTIGIPKNLTDRNRKKMLSKAISILRDDLLTIHSGNKNKFTEQVNKMTLSNFDKELRVRVDIVPTTKQKRTKSKKPNLPPLKKGSELLEYAESLGL